MSIPISAQAATPTTRRITLLIGGILTGVIALSIHVYFLDAWNLLPPQSPPPTGVLTSLSLVGKVVGMLLICHYAIDALRQRGWGFLKATLATFVLFAMLSESLIRVPIMNTVTTQSFAYPFITAYTNLIPALLTFFLCALATVFARNLRELVVAAIAVWACLKFLVAAPLKALMASIFSHAAVLARPEVYPAPYDWHVYVPAYLTYAEPVIGALLLLTLMWDRLPGRPLYRCVMAVGIVLLAKGLVFIPLAYAIGSPPGHRLLALLSMGQFSLESAALVLLTIATLTIARRVNSPSRAT